MLSRLISLLQLHPSAHSVVVRNARNLDLVRVLAFSEAFPGTDHVPHYVSCLTTDAGMKLVRPRVNERNIQDVDIAVGFCCTIILCSGMDNIKNTEGWNVEAPLYTAVSGGIRSHQHEYTFGYDGVRFRDDLCPLSTHYRTSRCHDELRTLCLQSSVGG
jgi:hypothetical protein